MNRYRAPSTDGRKEVGAALLLAAAVVVVYASSLASPFLFDDLHTVVHNAYIKSFSHVGQFFTASISSANVAPGMFRPLLMLSYACNYAAGGLNPAGYHLVNIWLHLLNALLVYLFMTRPLRQERRIALLAALLFAVHPLNSQAVIHIASRSALLATTWLLLGCLAYHHRQRPRRSMWLTAAAFGAGLLTKEIAVTLPALLVWTDWMRDGRPDWRGWARRLWPCLLLLAAYLGWRHHLYGVVTAPLPARDWWLNLGVSCRAVFVYLRLWLMPADLCLSRELPVPGALTEMAWWLPVAGYAGLWSVALWLGLPRPFGIHEDPLQHSANKQDRLRSADDPYVCQKGVALGLGWFLIALLPSHPIATLHLPASETHSYLPNIGWLLALGAAVSAQRAMPRVDRRRTIALGWLVVLWAMLTMQRVGVWKDDLRFWTAAVRCAPHTSGVRVSLAQAYEARGADAIALAVYQQALPLARTPVEEAQVRTDVGMLYWRLRRWPEAERELTRSLQLDATRAETYNDLGLVEEDAGRLDEAKRAYTQALALMPSLPDPSQNLGALALRAGRWAEAAAHFRDAITADPDRLSAYVGLAEAYEGQGKAVEAEAVYRQLQTLAPGNVEVTSRLERVRRRIRETAAP